MLTNVGANEYQVWFLEQWDKPLSTMVARYRRLLSLPAIASDGAQAEFDASRNEYENLTEGLIWTWLNEARANSDPTTDNPYLRQNWLDLANDRESTTRVPVALKMPKDSWVWDEPMPRVARASLKDYRTKGLALLARAEHDAPKDHELRYPSCHEIFYHPQNADRRAKWVEASLRKAFTDGGHWTEPFQDYRARQKDLFLAAMRFEDKRTIADLRPFTLTQQDFPGDGHEDADYDNFQFPPGPTWDMREGFLVPQRRKVRAGTVRASGTPARTPPAEPVCSSGDPAWVCTLQHEILAIERLTASLKSSRETCDEITKDLRQDLRRLIALHEMVFAYGQAWSEQAHSVQHGSSSYTPPNQEESAKWICQKIRALLDTLKDVKGKPFTTSSGKTYTANTAVLWTNPAAVLNASIDKARWETRDALEKELRNNPPLAEALRQLMLLKEDATGSGDSIPLRERFAVAKEAAEAELALNDRTGDTITAMAAELETVASSGTPKTAGEHLLLGVAKTAPYAIKLVATMSKCVGAAALSEPDMTIVRQQVATISNVLVQMKMVGDDVKLPEVLLAETKASTPAELEQLRSETPPTKVFPKVAAKTAGALVSTLLLLSSMKDLDRTKPEFNRQYALQIHKVVKGSTSTASSIVDMMGVMAGEGNSFARFFADATKAGFERVAAGLAVVDGALTLWEGCATSNDALVLKGGATCLSGLFGMLALVAEVPGLNFIAIGAAVVALVVDFVAAADAPKSPGHPFVQKQFAQIESGKDAQGHQRNGLPALMTFLTNSVHPSAKAVQSAFDLLKAEIPQTNMDRALETPFGWTDKLKRELVRQGFTIKNVEALFPYAGEKFPWTGTANWNG